MGDSQLVEDAAEYSFQELYKLVASHESISIIVNAAEIKKIKKGLSNVKMRLRQKEEEIGFQDDSERLEYTTIMLEGDLLKKYPGCIKLQISLIVPTSVKVNKVIIAGKDL